ncbi:MAG: ComF family protein [Erysipelotrichaceae bacterium]|nr:ComF family protein [Erysipelotrichaceae bacterium]
MRLKMTLTLLADLWFPRGLSCMNCGEDLFGERYALCKRCSHEIGFISGRVCRRCGRPLPELTTSICYACFGKQTSFKGNVAVAAYSQVAQKLIFRYKYKDKRFIGYHMAEMMADLLTSTWISDVDCVAGVPSSLRRKKIRGYCQMALIAGHLGELSGIRAAQDALVRTRETPRMKKLNREERSAALQNSFEVKDAAAVRGKSVLLIDDIMTSGATLEACSKALLEAGASEVYAMTFATVFDNQPDSKKSSKTK